jgi:hypothetical protein
MPQTNKRMGGGAYLELLDVPHLVVHLNLERIDFEELGAPLRLILVIHRGFCRGMEVTNKLNIVSLHELRGLIGKWTVCVPSVIARILSCQAKALRASDSFSLIISANLVVSTYGSGSLHPMHAPSPY